ncbi:MAG TPA: DUF1800 family protein [Saprospiraceae bacterium]|nr:DUF1800 family protein [Saprospiraceae bacterium]
MSTATCLKGTLDKYVPNPEMPWNESRVRHLLNKLKGGATLAEIQNALKESDPEVYIKKLFASAVSHPLPGDKNAFADYSYIWKDFKSVNIHTQPPPNQPPLEANRDYRGQYTVINQSRYNHLVNLWIHGMVKEGLRHKLALFWANHFVSTPDGQWLSFNYQYYYMIHYFALGNFKDFVYHIGRTPLMLIYLSGYVSGPVPNNNYARELLELFTMGPGNYTEKDIVEIARALTGWGIKTAYYNNGVVGEYFPVAVADFTNPDKLDNYYFRGKNYHDFGRKTFLGGTIAGRNPSTETAAKIAANSDYRDVIDIVFRQRTNEIAHFICTKLYKFYLYDDPPTAIVSAMADEFKKSWSIQDVLIKLFSSDHFFQEESMGLNIKSPFDMMIQFYRAMGLELDEDYFIPKYNSSKQIFENTAESGGIKTLESMYYQNSNLGQQLFFPPNVAGWKGYRSWLNEHTLVTRWRYMSEQFDYYLNKTSTREKYRQLLKDLTNNSKDPDFIVQKFAEHLFAIPLDEEYIKQAIGVFKAPVPSNYFINGTWSLDYSAVPTQILNTLKYFVTIPEFQLI